ncbi:MAG: DNA mismatch repair endonuclease MutL [Clostridia bacterium]|nr:DNA mismatch repair endonuclease MutL [Clostridia bacterium]
MAKINILPPEVFNKISAGEVVERPASVVKELVENSIDAGATQIEIRITEGGISKIVISDNGCGIEKEDLQKAFLPHATSKITTENDLYSIRSLGFRGEALASIGAVSEVDIISRTNLNTTGWAIHHSGGVSSEVMEKGSPVGTYICVNNIFYNTPARKKFLKTPKKEESEITSFITKLILANPNIAFKYYADEDLIYSSTGKGLEDAVYSIYGKDVLDELLPINVKSGNFNLSGYIGKTTFFKSNRTYQTVMINNRWVVDSIVNVACAQCYEAYMLKRCYPFYILNLTLPATEVDVNVHPNKLEVRFQDSKAIFAFIYNSVTNRLYDYLSNNTNEEMAVEQINEETAIFQLPKESPITTVPPKRIEVENSDNMAHSGNPATILKEIDIEKFTAPNGPTFLPTKLDFEGTEKITTTPKATQQNIMPNTNDNWKETLSTIVIGKAFNTYVIVESEDNLFFIDQHAAHERLLYDKYIASIEKSELSSQPLLLPYNITVNSLEEQFVLDKIEILRSIGFDIESFGKSTFKISAIPSILPDLNVTDFFNSFLSELNNFANIKSVDIIKDKLAETACKHAVKGGDDLNKNELIHLIKDLDGNVTKQCPHGRPFLMKFKRKEIEKWFKRIV